MNAYWYPDSTPSVARAPVREAFEQLRAAIDNASTMFAHEARVTSALLGVIDNEPSLTVLAASFPIAEERKRITAALDNFEISRRDARIALWRVMLSEDCTIVQIARVFGLSHQLVSRQLKDDGQTGDGL